VGWSGSGIVALDADGFEKLTTTPDYLDAAGRPMSAGPLTLDAYAVARIVDG
jgi:hypothetical protein